jgi:hypothetical protein
MHSLAAVKSRASCDMAYQLVHSICNVCNTITILQRGLLECFTQVVYICATIFTCKCLVRLETVTVRLCEGFVEHPTLYGSRLLGTHQLAFYPTLPTRSCSVSKQRYSATIPFSGITIDLRPPNARSRETVNYRNSAIDSKYPRET